MKLITLTLIAIFFVCTQGSVLKIISHDNTNCADEASTTFYYLLNSCYAIDGIYYNITFNNTSYQFNSFNDSSCIIPTNISNYNGKLSSCNLRYIVKEGQLVVAGGQNVYLLDEIDFSLSSTNQPYTANYINMDKEKCVASGTLVTAMLYATSCINNINSDKSRDNYYYSCDSKEIKLHMFQDTECSVPLATHTLGAYGCYLQPWRTSIMKTGCMVDGVVPYGFPNRTSTTSSSSSSSSSTSISSTSVYSTSFPVDTTSNAYKISFSVLLFVIICTL